MNKFFVKENRTQTISTLLDFLVLENDHIVFHLTKISIGEDYGYNYW